MNLQRGLEREAHNYIKETLHYRVLGKLLWNEGGELYSIVSDAGEEKTLFATCLEKEKYLLKDLYKKIAEESNSKYKNSIICHQYECREVINADGKTGCYIFIVLERITPLIEMVLEETFIDGDLGNNQKLIKIYSAIVDTCKGIKYINESFSNVNVFINNEELCVDDEGNIKLLLFDMIKNDICTNNQAVELKLIFNRIAKSVGVENDLYYKSGSIEEIEYSCNEKRKQLEELESQYKQRFDEYMERADRADASVWYNIGCMYETGRGIKADYKEAIKWYEKAATKKHVKALNNLARMYQKGQGVKKDYEVSREYLLKAAKLNDHMAQFNLGILYQAGKGVDKDLEKALYWYKKSMKNGNKTARRMYMRIKDR